MQEITKVASSNDALIPESTQNALRALANLCQTIEVVNQGMECSGAYSSPFTMNDMQENKRIVVECGKPLSPVAIATIENQIKQFNSYAKVHPVEKNRQQIIITTPDSLGSVFGIVRYSECQGYTIVENTINGVLTASYRSQSYQ